MADVEQVKCCNSVDAKHADDVHNNRRHFAAVIDAVDYSLIFSSIHWLNPKYRPTLSHVTV